MIAGLVSYLRVKTALAYMTATDPAAYSMVVVAYVVAGATVTSPGIPAALRHYKRCLRLHSPYCYCRNWETLHLEMQTQCVPAALPPYSEMNSLFHR